MSQAVAPVVQVGLVAAPGAPAELAGWLAGELGTELAAAHPQVRWEVRAVEDGLVQPPADDDEIVAATRRRLLTEERDLAVALTDVPLEVDRRPVVGSASPVHGVALLSLPALGAVGLRKRALQTALGLVRTLLGTPEDADADDHAAMGTAAAGAGHRPGRRHRGRGLHRPRADRQPAAAAGDGAGQPAVAPGGAAVPGAHRGHRGRRLRPHHRRHLAAGRQLRLATADRRRRRLGGGRRGHARGRAQLWERPRSPRVRKQVLLFGVATTATVVIGVLTLYAVLFVLALVGALLLVVGPLFTEGLGHPASLSDHLEPAWLTCSLATVGGALGAGLESDDAVREAAYTYRSEQPAH